MDKRLAYASATELMGLIATKQISPVELTELFLNRIDTLDSRLNSFILLTHDSAVEAAKNAEAAVVRGDELGPLHGLPIAIKDTQNTGGVRTTMGSLLFKDRVPERDAAVVERVKGAGAIVMGKTNVQIVWKPAYQKHPVVLKIVLITLKGQKAMVNWIG